MRRRRLTVVTLGSWLLIIMVGGYLYVVRADIVRDGMLALSSSSAALAAFAYFVTGCIRGFTLIPVTYLIPFGLLFLTPLVHFLLTMAGIMVSSPCIYYFAERFQLAEYFEVHHAGHVERVRDLLQRRELPIVIGWSLFPFVPTDLICYVCGSLKINIRKMLTGVFIGEGIICAVYIFAGRQLIGLLW